MARRKRKKIREANWQEYFQRIQGVCPWSWRAWKNEKISILSWDGNIESLGAYDAKVYVHINASPRLLNKLATKLGKIHTDCEFLWSHPRYKGVSSPLPCIIQQDKVYLLELRSKITK